MIYIYRTNQEWYQFLKVNGITQDVNFFRRTQGQPQLVIGDYFYFMDRNNQQIVGRGRYVLTQDLSIQNAWDEYGIRNGAADFNVFRDLILNVLNQVNNNDIQCIKITDIQWLDNNQFMNDEYDMFPRRAATNNARAIVNDDNIFRLNVDFEQRFQLNRINEYYLNENLPGPVQRISVNIDSIIRDQNLVRQVKLIRENTCQICETRLGTAGRPYSEVHHIQPLGGPHIGDDILGNMICVCPNCHKKLDYLYIPIDENLIIEQNNDNHTIHERYIQWHNDRFERFGRR
jgi:hypothetical protein